MPPLFINANGGFILGADVYVTASPLCLAESVFGLGAGVVLGAAPPLFLGDCGARLGADTESSTLFFGGNGGFGLGAGALLGAVPPLCLGGDGFGLGVGVTPGSAPPPLPRRWRYRIGCRHRGVSPITRRQWRLQI